MDDNYAEDLAGQIREMMESFDLPHLKITVEDVSVPSLRSVPPLKVLSSKIEALVNGLLWDIDSAEMEEAKFLLSQLEEHVDSLISLSALLRLKDDKNKETTSGASTEAPAQKVEEPKEELKPTPIPKIFSEALKEIMDKKKRKGR